MCSPQSCSILMFWLFLSVSFSVRSVEKARSELLTEIAQLRAKAQEEQKKRENQDSLVRRLQKRVLLLTKVCKKYWLPRSVALVKKTGLHFVNFLCSSKWLYFTGKIDKVSFLFFYLVWFKNQRCTQHFYNYYIYTFIK